MGCVMAGLPVPGFAARGVEKRCRRFSMGWFSIQLAKIAEPIFTRAQIVRFSTRARGMSVQSRLPRVFPRKTRAMNARFLPLLFS